MNTRDKNPKPPAVVDPSTAVVGRGGFISFTLKREGEREAWPTWTLLDPDAGWMDGNTFHGHNEHRTSHVTLTGTTADGKHSAEAQISFKVGPAPGDGPTFVDDWSIHGFARGVEWNDPKGRRAGRLILDALMQLPPDFLRAVGHVALVRMSALEIGGLTAHGIHLPFLTRAVLLFDKGNIDTLEPSATKFGTAKGEADYKFVRTFIHELAHVVLANRSISNFDRWMLLGGLHAAVLAPRTGVGFLPLTLLTTYSYAKYYSPWATRDFVSQYAAVSGWVINNPNPLGMFFNQNTMLPNAVTGLAALKLGTGLRNLAVTPPTTLSGDAHYQQFGFASRYASTDVHEDFAEAVAAIAMGEPIASDPRFNARRDFIHDHGIWPKGWAPIRPGAELNAWALKAKKEPSDATLWAVDFGAHAGRPRHLLTNAQPAVKPGPPNGPAGPVSPRARVFSVEDAEPATTPPSAGAEPSADPDAWLGLGKELEHPWGLEETRQAVTATLGVARAVEADRAQHEVVAPALASVREALEQLAVPLDEESRLGLLRAAERHGTGLTLLGAAGAAVSVGDDGVVRLAGVEAAVGDLLFDERSAVFVVAEVDGQGGITRLAAEAEETPTGKLRAPKAEAEDLRFHWRPSRALRTWDEAPERAPALGRLIGLWGKAEGARGSDLSLAGGLAAEVLTAHGIRHRGLLEADADGVADYLGRLGAGVEPLPKTGARVVAGELVRARKGGLWGLCTRGTSRGDGRVDVLWQGGVKPRAGEEEGAVTLHHGVEVATLSHRWSPSGTRD